MDPCYANYSEDIYSPAMMTPPPDDLDCNLDVRPPKQTAFFREPPKPESLPRTMVLTTTHHRQSSINSNASRRRSTATSEAIFSPRDPLEIHRERDYVGSEWEKQNHLLNMKQIRQYSATEGSLNTLPDSATKQRRRLRKQLSKLRGEMLETSNSLRALTIRWSELCLEQQSYETWAQAQWERRCATPTEYFTLSPLSIPQEPLRSNETPQNTPLDATSPSFIPRGMFIDEIMVSSPLRKLETVEEAGEECPYAYKQAYEYEAPECEAEEEEETSKVGSQRRSSFDDEIFSPREKRLSLPDLQSMWL